MKTFVNCTPDEFMAQAAKIRAPFAEWIKKIGAKEIRARLPEGFDDMTPEEQAKAATKQANENLGDIIAAAMEQDMEATKNLMCLITFTDPKDFNKHTMVEYLAAILETMSSGEVRGFFTFYLAPMLKTSSEA